MLGWWGMGPERTSIRLGIDPHSPSAEALAAHDGL